MGERTHNFLVGVTALVSIAGLAVLLTLFGYVPKWMEQGYRITVEMPDAAGMGEGSRVWLHGIDVGRVETVELQQPPKRGVRVVARIRKDILLPAGSRASGQAPFLGGNPTMSIETAHLDDSTLGQYLPTDGSATIRGEVPTMLTEFARQIQASLGGSMERFEQLAGDFELLSKEWVTVGKNINLLLEPRTAGDVDAGAAVANLSTVVARADERMRELKKALDGINTWVNDEELREQIRTVATNAGKAAQKLNAGADRITEIAGAVGDNVDRLAKQYVAVADDLSKAVDEIRLTVQKAREGEGTVGKLINDPALYQNLNDAVQRMNEALLEFKLLIEKWKAEGVPIQL